MERDNERDVLNGWDLEFRALLINNPSREIFYYWDFWGLFHGQNTHIISLVGQKLLCQNLPEGRSFGNFKIIIVNMMAGWSKALNFSSQPGFKSRPNFFNFCFILIDVYRSSIAF